MGMPRKGSRRTHIGDHTYLWRVQRVDPPSRLFGRSPGLHFLLIVQRDQESMRHPGSMAFFQLECRSQMFKCFSWSGFGSPDKPGTNISSSDVRELVEFALEQGWDPEDADGPPFWVWADEHQSPELPGFNLSLAA